MIIIMMIGDKDWQRWGPLQPLEVQNLKPSACTPPPSNTTGSGASSRTQLEIYPEQVTRASVSSSRSVIGFAAASNAEVAGNRGSNPPEKRVQFWFAKVASLNPTWVLLVFETHNFGTGRTNDVWQLHVVTSSNPA